MWRRCVMAAVLGLAAAMPSLKTDDNTGSKEVNPPYPNCTQRTVTSGRAMSPVEVHDTLTLAVLPSHSWLNLNILVGQSVYRTSVEGTMISLKECKSDSVSSCRELDSGGSKGSDIIVAHSWNKVDVTFTGKEITVVVGDFKVMGVAMEGPVSTPLLTLLLEDDSGHRSAERWIHVNYCESTEMPDQSEMTHAPPVTQAPDDLEFPGCPVFEVSPSQPMPYVALDHSLALALYPNTNMMVLEIHAAQAVYKASIEGTMINLLRCDARGGECSVINSGGTKGSDVIIPFYWNLVNISLHDGEISVTVNERDNVMGGVMEAEEGVELTLMAYDPVKPTTHRQHYHVIVNLHCTDSIVPVTRLVTSAIIDSTTASPAGEDGAPVGIIVGVLVGLLVLVALAVTVSCIRKRRSMDVSQHTQFQDQH